ncbi:MAG: M23 family metallopeptidase [Saprospirales bacterium]|nr:MAG: M23 family metallopeptidase [Saprospirales bacterium]
MKEPKGKAGGSFFTHLKTPYRLIILNNETLEEKTSFQLTLLNLYMLICTIGLISGIIVVSLIVFTPLKTYIPGYADYTQTSEFIEMNRQVKELSAELQAQIVYTDAIHRILTGEHETLEDVMIDESSENGEPIIAERIPEDEELRQEVDLREALNFSSATTISEPAYNLNFISPIQGFVSMGFDPASKHHGVDIIAPQGSPVKAIMDGVVFTADWTLKTGNSIGILHRGNMVSFYKHNAYFLKEPGDRVSAGEVIAIIGNTGTHTDGPHLHFELWMDDSPVDPEKYISFN